MPLQSFEAWAESGMAGTAAWISEALVVVGATPETSRRSALPSCSRRNAELRRTAPPVSTTMASVLTSLSGGVKVSTRSR